MKNAFTIDLEDWFCSHNLQAATPFESWPQQELRVVANTRKILGLLKEYRIEATFFVLGWIAKQSPELIQEIEDGGHEIASHGYNHTLLTAMTPDEFRFDLEQFLQAVTPLTKQKITGYRAPAFSVTEQTLWVIDVLKEFGFEYDSSVFPMGMHPDYGISKAPLKEYFHYNSIREIPLSCAEVAFKRIPCSGGGYFRLYPYNVFKILFKKCNSDGRPGIFYLHPWEIDTDPPKVKLPFQQRVRHYQNIDKTYERLEMLLQEFEFTSIRKLLKDNLK
jgi:polysaccharide deacetylase family protein (PEP-CTERM system associated)